MHSLSSFFQACGVSGGFTLNLTSEETGKTFSKSIAMPFAIVGRNPEASLRLDDPRVNSRHAYLQVVAGQLLCVDLMSRNGVYWGERAEKSGWLGADESIRIEPFHLRLAEPLQRRGQDMWNDSKKLLARSSDEESQPRIVLEFCNAAQSNRRSKQTWQLDRVLTLVGKSPDCKVRFNDVAVSTFHCSLVRTQHSLWVVDLLSRKGIKLNGKRLRWGEIHDKDELQIGNFVIRFHCAPPLAPRAKRTSTSLELVLTDSSTRFARGKPDLPASPSESGHSAAPPVQFPAAVASQDSGNHKSGDNFQQTDFDSAQMLAMAPVGNHADFWKGIIAPMFSQFSAMHQQMFDQFQNTLLTVVQMLNKQQQTHYEMIREEMDRIRELNQELATLQRELLSHEAKKKRRSKKTPTQEAKKRRSDKVKSDEELYSSGLNELVKSGVAVTPHDFPERSSAQKDERHTLPSHPQENGVPSDASVSQTPSEGVAADAALNQESGPPTPVQKKLRSDDDNDKKKPPEGSFDKVHTLITDRLRVLQAERQSLWQRIMKKLMG